jgi:hypothetical protein
LAPFVVVVVPFTSVADALFGSTVPMYRKLDGGTLDSSANL